MEFTVEKQNLYDLLSPQNRGFHIPSFQRPLTWDKPHISRLFEDIGVLIEEICAGVNSKAPRIANSKFMGSMILLDDNEREEVLLTNRPHLPSDVLTIVDGQQRLSVFSVLFVVLHNKLAQCTIDPEISSSISDEVISSYNVLIKDQMLDLTSLFCLSRNGDDVHRFYPKLIRPADDICSWRSNIAVYSSPIGRFIWEYIVHINSNEPTLKFSYPANKQSNNLHNYLADTFNRVNREVDNVLDNVITCPEQILRLIDASEVRLEDELLKICCDGEVAEAVKSKMLDGLSSVALSKIITTGLFFMVARTTELQSGFDIFDALNTTGEPLTAIETYRPTIIKSCGGVEQFQDSKHFKHFERIQQYLDSAKSSEEKQVTTANMVIQFSMSEDGDKLPTKLNHQRNYLKKRTESNEMQIDPTPSNHEENALSIVDLTRRLSYLADFMRHVWDDPKSYNFGDIFLDPEEQLGITYFNDLNHSVVIPPLFRFYTRICRARDDKNEINELATHFQKAILASVAFSTIWRSATGTTDNIDSVYRNVMKDYLCVDCDNLDYSVDQYCQYLRDCLHEKNIDHVDNWIQRAKSVPIYRNAKVVSKLLLFLAADGAVVRNRPSSCFLEWSGRRAGPEQLSPTKWKDKIDLEHIAPQPNREGERVWKEPRYNEIYEDEARDTIVNYLGNLLVVPKLANQILKNKSWKQKRKIYCILGSQTDPELERGLESELDRPLTKAQKNVLRDSNYLMLCRAVGMHKEDWTKKSIERRTSVLLRMAWKRMLPWLIEFTHSK